MKATIAIRETALRILNMRVDSIDLSDLALRRLPKHLSKLSDLKYVNLLKNNIDWKQSEKTLLQLGKDVRFYVSVTDLTKIKKENWWRISGVEITKKGLRKIPNNIINQSQIEYLDLSSFLHSNTNYFKDIKDLKNLVNLNYLDLSETYIDSGISVIGYLTKLKTLNLSQTNIRTLPSEIGNLKNLESLSIWDTQISILPPEINVINLASKLLIYKP